MCKDEQVGEIKELRLNLCRSHHDIKTVTMATIRNTCRSPQKETQSISRVPPCMTAFLFISSESAALLKRAFEDIQLKSLTDTSPWQPLITSVAIIKSSAINTL